MKLRSLPIRAMLAAGLALAVLPSYGLSRRGDKDTPSQQSQNTSNALPYPGKVVERVIVRVDDRVIDSSDYKRAEKDLDQEAKQENWSPEELAQQKKNLLRNLIDKQLLLAKGKQLGISGEDELIHRLDQIRKQNHLGSMQALQEAVESQGLSWQDFKQQIRQGIIQSQVIRQKVTPNIRIGPEEMKAYYENHKSEFKHPEQERLSEILIPTPNPDDAAEVAKAKARADAIEKQLRSGAKFAKLAKEDSKGPMANQGGDLGMFQKGQLAPVLEKDTFPLKTGQFTEPIQTRQGWIILKVTKHEDAGVAPLSQVQNRIMNTIGMAKMQPALRKYLAKLRQEAYIDIRPGYSDTGATANEVRPTYSAYLPPKEKTKKKPHFRRKRFESKRTLAKREKKKKTEKLGKREKIRFGQAPREALPPALNQTDLNNQNGQVAANSEPEAAAGGQSQEIQKPTKRRYSSVARKQKRERQKEKKKVDTHHPAPVVGQLNEATQKEQESSLGLGGVTKKEKAHPARQGPKRRYTNVQEKKEKEQKKQQGSSSTNSGSDSGSDSGTGSGSGTGSSNTQQ